jgi:Lrp/AsnC family transcriptional regulator, regulator of ectoine-degradation genes
VFAFGILFELRIEIPLCASVASAAQETLRIACLSTDTSPAAPGVGGKISMKLDRFDLKILEALQADGRLPASRLAERVGLSSSPTWERVRKLEEAGVVRGYHADIAVEQLTPVTTVIVPVVLENHRTQDFKRFQQLVEKTPEIVECWAVGGGVDYVLRFLVPSVDSYQALIERLLQADVGIQRYWSYIVTKSVKPFAGLPISLLTQE